MRRGFVEERTGTRACAARRTTSVVGAMFAALVLAGATISLAGCGYDPGTRAVTGGLMGAGAGAGIAALTGGKPATGALIGGGVGAVGGALTAPR